MDASIIADQIRDRASRLFKYLAERTRLSSRPVLDIRSSRTYEPVLWLEEVLPEEPEIWSVHRDEPREDEEEGDEQGDATELDLELIRIERVIPQEAPDPPEECIEWIDGGEDIVADWKGDQPQLLELRLVDNPHYDPDDEDSDEPETIKERLEDHLDVAEAWEHYISKQWLPWQVERKRIDGIQKIYTRLFEIRAILERDEEEYELIVASSLLAWRTEKLGRGADKIVRHLVTLPIRIEIESETGTLRVVTDAEIPTPKLETEMIPPTMVPSLDGVPDIERGKLGDTRVLIASPLHRGAALKAVKPWCFALSGEAEISDSPLPPERIEKDEPPEVTFAPALILRKRPSTSLTAAFETSEKQILGGGDIPFNLQRVVDQIEDTGFESDEDAQGDDRDSRDSLDQPLFPLPSNDEQFRIAKRLANSHGVLVQGPPGTGKTHTIANLICHLLAAGKRILVTSAKARPLMVLHGKLPSEVQPLCLTSLGGGREESEQLKRSVDGILKHFTAYDPDDNRELVQRIQEEIRRLHSEVGKLLNQRKERHEVETRDQSVAGGEYEGSSMEINGRLIREKENFGWLRDVIPEDLDCPVGPSWGKRVVELLRVLPREVRNECARKTPLPNDLMGTADFRELAKREGLLKDELIEIREDIQNHEEEIDRRKSEETKTIQKELEELREELSYAKNDLAAERRRSKREKRKMERQIKEAEEHAAEERRRHLGGIDTALKRLKSDLRHEKGNEPDIEDFRGDKIANAVASLPGEDPERARVLADKLESLRDRAAKSGWKWPERAAEEIVTGVENLWARVFGDSQRYFGELPDEGRIRELESLVIRTPPELSHEDLYFDAKELLGHYQSGGGNGFLFFKPEIVKRTEGVRRSTVNGVTCDKQEALHQLVAYLEAERGIEELHETWSLASRRVRNTEPTNYLPDTYSLIHDCHEILNELFEVCVKLRGVLGGAAAYLRSTSEAARSVRRGQRALSEHKERMEEWKRNVSEIDKEIAGKEVERARKAQTIETILEEEIEEIRASFVAADPSRVEELKDEVQDLQDQLEDAREVVADDGERRIAPKRRRKEEIEGLLGQLSRDYESTRQAVAEAIHSPFPHPICKRLVKALDQANAQEYSDCIAHLKQLELHRPNYRKLLERLAPLKDLSPKTWDWLIDSPLDEESEHRLLEFRRAWNWSRAYTWVEAYRANSLEDIDIALRKTERKIADLTAEQSGLLAWRHCKEASTQAQQEALKAWEKAIKRVGKGKGKWAAKNRRDAHANMKIAQGMIPALVTPLARLVESLAIEPGMFDVIIVDEASQLGPEGLLLFYLAKQVVIVGDDEQISPEYVGLDQAEVHALINKYLKGTPGRDALSVNSLFDQADIRFTVGRITLREHFRCVPEIISFSNQLCYKDETGRPQLVPLRKVSGDRLRPALRAEFIEGGFKEDNGINEPEAEAIVEAIARCVKDPAYNKKTLGVISLLGKSQAEHIQRRLIETIGTDVMEGRKLICGDAYSFQGDERDVMFLSLVIAPNARYAKLTKKTDKQRFNVAASRAKDQMWLFHSVALKDLSPEDLRYQLLYHCKAVEEDRAYVLEEELEKCDSDFEREVARYICNRGYRVWCQVKVAHYRIDLVVEGSDGGQLAVECDGDRYHGPDRFEADIQRQRILERCGWKFWRVWGSEFAADPEAATENLWQTLKAEGIQPLD